MKPDANHLKPDTGLDSIDVFNRLSHSNARLQNQLSLKEGVGVAIWSNHNDRTEYESPKHHTLSCYIQGGFDIVRLQGHQRRSGGAPGRICLMPAEHKSQWEVNGELSFFHLYFDDKALSNTYERVFDKSPISSLPDLTFADNQWLDTFCQQMVLPLNWHDNADQLMLSTAADMMLTHVVSEYSGKIALPEIKGGLSVRAQRIVCEYVETHLDTSLHIDELSAQVGLSSYHFARMFKKSFQITPHQYVTERRLQVAFRLISQGQKSFSDIALTCGFTDQSHFSKQFKKRFGVTPRQKRTEAF